MDLGPAGLSEAARSSVRRYNSVSSEAIGDGGNYAGSSLRPDEDVKSSSSVSFPVARC